jgi:hypothetical protein
MGAGQNVVLLAVREVAEGAESSGVWWIVKGESFCDIGAVPAFVINVTGAVKFGGDAVLVMVRCKDLVGKRKCRGGPLWGIKAVGAILVSASKVCSVVVLVCVSGERSQEGKAVMGCVP